MYPFKFHACFNPNVEISAMYRHEEMGVRIPVEAAAIEQSGNANRVKPS